MQIKVRHKVCSLARRRACRLDEAVEVDTVYNTSGNIDKGLNEGLELKLLGVGNFESCQLIFPDLLAMDSDKGQSHISATTSRRLFPLLHSTRDFFESSHQ